MDTEQYNTCVNSCSFLVGFNGFLLFSPNLFVPDSSKRYNNNIIRIAKKVLNRCPAVHRGTIGSIIREAVHEGKVLYERAA